MEILKHPACTVGWVARFCRSWLFPGKAIQISQRHNTVVKKKNLTNLRNYNVTNDFGWDEKNIRPVCQGAKCGCADHGLRLPFCQCVKCGCTDYGLRLLFCQCVKCSCADYGLRLPVCQCVKCSCADYGLRLPVCQCVKCGCRDHGLRLR